MRSAKAFLLAAVFTALLVPTTASAATPAPAWSIQSLAAPTNFEPGDSSGKASYQVFFTNSGGAVTDESQIILTDTLPAGIGVESVELSPPRAITQDIDKACETTTAGEVATVTCKVTNAVLAGAEAAKLYPGNQLLLRVNVTIPPSASGTLINEAKVEGGGAPPATATAENQASAEEAKAGFEEFKAELTGVDGKPTTEADSFPYQYTISFAVNLVPGPEGTLAPYVPAGGNLKEIEVALPPGLAGNPTVTDRCSAQDFNTLSASGTALEGTIFTNLCSNSTVVGLASVEQLEGRAAGLKAPIYNLEPPRGMPAQFGFEVLGAPLYINTKVRSDGDYGITAYLHNVTEASRVTASRISFWGTPWEGSHDAMRGICAMSQEGTCPVEGTARPLLRMPSSCSNPLLTSFSFSTWAQPAQGAAASSGQAAPGECEAPDFSPSIESRPTTNVADQPSGLHFSLALPQSTHEDPEGLGEADLREAVVRLPAGLAVNPASATGRAACTPTQIGLTTPPGTSPVHFNLNPAQCPNAAKVGSVSANVPALDHPLEGSVYLASQEDNPFNSLLAIYIVLEDEQSGIVVKLAGKVEPDPLTGQLTTTVRESPQLPVADFRFDFFEGPRAPLRTPAKCATYTTTTQMTPWTAPAGKTATPSDSFAITTGPGGSCPSGALDPKLAAGLGTPTAYTYSPFSLRLTRPDASEELASVEAVNPTSVTAKLAGIPYCPEAAIAQASARSAPGQGRLEAASPSCPAASQVGTTTAGAGAGPTPYYTGGNVYLAGPYKSAPLSLVAIVPAVAGPFDLGVIVNRIALKIDPETAQVTAQSDPLPQILSGIPLDVRDIRVVLDRSQFTLAGTSCDPKTISANVVGVAGSTKTVSDRFQLGGCGSLRFKPAVSLKLNGGTKRGSHPALKAILTYPKGPSYANTAKASVALPHSEFLDQAHIRTICTRVQFAAKACPKGSIYGKAKATTPLLDKPLSGPVYLRSSNNPLPDLVLALHGQIDVVAVGRIDSHNGGIRASFESVPDAPITKVTLEMQGGKKGLLINSRDICKHTNRATARLTGQNGKTYDTRPLLKDSCKKKPGKGKGGKQGKGGK